MLDLEVIESQSMKVNLLWESSYSQGSIHSLSSDLASGHFSLTQTRPAMAIRRYDLMIHTGSAHPKVIVITDIGKMALWSALLPLSMKLVGPIPNYRPFSAELVL